MHVFGLRLHLERQPQLRCSQKMSSDRIEDTHIRARSPSPHHRHRAATPSVPALPRALQHAALSALQSCADFGSSVDIALHEAVECGKGTWRIPLEGLQNNSITEHMFASVRKHGGQNAKLVITQDGSFIETALPPPLAPSQPDAQPVKQLTPPHSQSTFNLCNFCSLCAKTLAVLIVCALAYSGTTPAKNV